MTSPAPAQVRAGHTPGGWVPNLKRCIRITAGAGEFRIADAAQLELNAMREGLLSVVYELAALIPVPGTPKIEDWPCANPADRECLQKAYVAASAALALAGARS